MKKKTIDILKNIKKIQDVVNEELRRLSGSTNVELEEGFIIFRPSFLDIFTITANDEFYINALIDKFIVLANYSLSHPLHSSQEPA